VIETVREKFTCHDREPIAINGQSEERRAGSAATLNQQPSPSPKKMLKESTEHDKHEQHGAHCALRVKPDKTLASMLEKPTPLTIDLEREMRNLASSLESAV
jgi:hypothetical protein